jgi:hypothetical protein
VSKAYTDSDLADQLDADLTWRVRELSDLKAAIKAGGTHKADVLLRALVAMVYAHWEGHVRFCANKYFEYLTIRRFKFTELDRQIYVNHFLARIDALYGRRASVEERCRLVQEILSSQDQKFSRTNPSLVDTRSNLSTEVLSDICRICGVNYSIYEGEDDFIDVIILKRRNGIAHGEDVLIGYDEVDRILERSISLMRRFKDAIQNNVFLRTYQAKHAP